MRYGTSNKETGLRFTRGLPVLLAMAGALLAFMVMGATTAKAEPVGYEFDGGVINLGGEEGTWGTLIDPSIGDPPASIAAEVAADGTLTAAAEDFVFPPKRIEGLETGNSTLPVVDANILITAEGPLVGDFDFATGESNVSIPADVLITVYSAGSPAAAARCRVDGFPLNLSTELNQLNDPGDPTADPPRPSNDYDSSPFAPPSGDGAMIATWNGLPASEVVSGALATIVCPALDDMLGGPGGTWMDGEAGSDIEPDGPTAPTLAPKITGTPASSTESTTAEFKFEVDENEPANVTGFVCKLDAGAFEPCDSGTKTYSGLAVGAHRFEVKSTNSGGEGPATTYDWNITKVAPPEGKARLAALKIAPKNKKVKRGKKAVFKVKVRNAGDAAARNVKVCVNAPKKFVKVKKCVKIGNLGAKKTKNAKFKVTVKKKARKGKKLTLRFKATSANAGGKKAKATLKVN
jgi:hypothetical protein